MSLPVDNNILSIGGDKSSGAFNASGSVGAADSAIQEIQVFLEWPARNDTHWKNWMNRASNTIKNRLAVQHLSAGGVVAYPTEAVWGLGCDPLNYDAVQRLLALKGRSEKKGLILITGSLDHIDFLLDPLSASQRDNCLSAWPGPVTWLLPDSEQLIPTWIKGAHEAVAVRVSNHPQVQSLCKSFGGPLVSTSANLSGRQAILYPWKIIQNFKGQVYLYPGQLGSLRKPTQIMDAITGRVIRSGDIKG